MSFLAPWARQQHQCIICTYLKQTFSLLCVVLLYLKHILINRTIFLALRVMSLKTPSKFALTIPKTGGIIFSCRYRHKLSGHPMSFPLSLSPSGF